jgi:hypothetical protein
MGHPGMKRVKEVRVPTLFRRERESRVGTRHFS